MKTSIIQQVQQDVKKALILKQEKSYPPLDSETRPAFNTDEAAHYLNRKSQTLRAWACLEHGPIRPVRINGRLAWRVADVKRLLEGGA